MCLRPDQDGNTQAWAQATPNIYHDSHLGPYINDFRKIFLSETYPHLSLILDYKSPLPSSVTANRSSFKWPRGQIGLLLLPSRLPKQAIELFIPKSGSVLHYHLAWYHFDHSSGCSGWVINPYSNNKEATSSIENI